MKYNYQVFDISYTSLSGLLLFIINLLTVIIGKYLEIILPKNLVQISQQKKLQ